MKSIPYKYLTLLLALLNSAQSKESGYVFTQRAFTEDRTWVYEVPAGTGPQITMCWESDASTIVAPNGLTYDFATIRSRVRSIVEAQWQQYAKVYFWWKTSHNDPQCDVTIGFYSSDNALGVVKGGVFEGYHEIYLNIDWMVPIQENTWRAGKNKGPREWWNSATPTKRRDSQYGFLQETALHEFGHVLGFAHEHLRTQEGRALFSYTIFDLGDREIGAYDKFSIMNYFRLYLSGSEFPAPKLSCGDVASVRVLYGPNPNHPDVAANCYVEKIKPGTIENMSEQQLTNWVSDPNLNTSAKTLGASNNNPMVVAMPGSAVSKAFIENVAVEAVPSPNPPGYFLTLSLKDPNFEGVSCSSPVRITDMKVHTVEKSWTHGTQCAEYDDCSWVSLPEVSLSSCNPSFTKHIPMGKGTWYTPNSFVYEDCAWKNEGLLGYLGEKVTFGVVIRNGDYVCVERNGMYSEVNFQVNGKGTGMFELPFNLDRAMGFYPLIMESDQLSRVNLKLKSGDLMQRYWVEMFEVTQGKYYSVTGKLPSTFIGIASRPVESVTWFDAILYCNLRSMKEGLSPVYSYTAAQYHPITGSCIGLSNLQQDIRENGYRLPTLDEWKQVKKEGTASFCPGETNTLTVDHYWLWHSGNSNNVTHPVGQKKPSPLGLFDMRGNVEEWVWDAKDAQASRRWTAGGAYNSYPMCSGNGLFGDEVATEARAHIGFRVMRRASDLTPSMMLLLD